MMNTQERVYRVILTLPMTGHPTLTVMSIRAMFPFLGKLHSAHRHVIRAKEYMIAIFDGADPNLAVLLNNALIAGSLSAYRVQLAETDLGD